MKKRSFRTYAGITCFIVSIVGLLGCVADTIIYRFNNPSLTDIEVILSRPEPTIVGIVFVIIGFIGRALLGV